MTNKELITLFEKAEQESENIFDIYDILSVYQDAYSEMHIASIVPTIYDAYKTYNDYDGKIMRWLQKITMADFSNIADAFDVTKLFNDIPEEYKESVSKLLQLDTQ